MTAAEATLECTGCQTVYRVRKPERLKPSTRSTCRTCGRGFAVVEGPVHSATISRTGQAEERSYIGQFAFHGNGKTLCGIHFVNMFFTLATMGLYHFWAKVKMRRYLFSQTSCAGDRFSYHGNGKELFVGFLRALVLFGIPYGLLTVVPEFSPVSPWVKVVTGWLGALLAMIYIPVAVVGARRYRMNRTTWRGIQFSFRGRAWSLIVLSFKGYLLTVLSLGAYFPHYQAQKYAFLVSNTFWGNTRFKFDGNGWGLTPVWVLSWVYAIPILALLVVTIGAGGVRSRWVLVSLWFVLLAGLGQLWINYQAKKQQFYWNHTIFAGARFRSTVEYAGLRNLYMVNAVLLIVSLGMAWPWVMARTTSYYLANLALQESPNLSDIQQDPRGTSTTGEGLANFLDAGFELD